MPPVTIMVKPASSDCNMRCRYCFYSDVASRRECASMGRMSSSTLENLVRRAMRYADGQLTLAFQGGEPTLEQICGLPDGGEDALHVAGEYRRLRQLYR